MGFKIFCRILSEKPLPYEISNFLLESALQMVKEKITKKEIKRSDFEMVIFTSFRKEIICSILWTLFFAEIKTGNSQIFVSYLVRTEDLKRIDFRRGFWVREIPAFVRNAIWN